MCTSFVLFFFLLAGTGILKTQSSGGLKDVPQQFANKRTPVSTILSGNTSNKGKLDELYTYKCRYSGMVSQLQSVTVSFLILLFSYPVSSPCDFFLLSVIWCMRPVFVFCHLVIEVLFK